MNPEEVQKAVPKNTKYGLTCKKISYFLFFKFTFPLPTSRKNFMQPTENDAHITEFDKISTEIGGDNYNKNPDLNSSWQ